jgi:tetratricopeptide (TPR) repeat protein
MRIFGTGGTDRDFRRGIRELAYHRPDLALRSFRQAADSCPATFAAELSRNLYYLAIALLRMDRPELALKSLASAQKLRPRGIARSAYLHRSNAYGMCRQASPELDDFYAFYSIQACIYLERKGSCRFDSNAEKDTITRLIGDAWLLLSNSGRLSRLTAGRKLELFKAQNVSLPLFGFDGAARGKVLVANFRSGRAVSCDDRCPCGSGLPYIRCCGRSASPRERSAE